MFPKATNSWTPLSKMATKRYYSASVPVKGKLLVLGGWDDDNRLATSEYVSPAWRCIPASMTSRLHHHLHIESSSLDTIISILCTSSNHCHPWNFDRSSFGCATFNSPMHENREVVLAVGGYGQATAEVYDYTQPNATWTKSNNWYVMYMVVWKEQVFKKSLAIT